VANASFGLPDLGITSLNDVCEVHSAAITQATALPLLVDADTGWGGAFMIARTIREMTARRGRRGCHSEDQVQAKRADCPQAGQGGSVGASEMTRPESKAAVDARTDSPVHGEGPESGRVTRASGISRRAIRHARPSAMRRFRGPNDLRGGVADPGPKAYRAFTKGLGEVPVSQT